jgi:hypothetical protein
MSDHLPWSASGSSGSYFEVCNCEAVCPCRRHNGQPGGRATYDTCDFAASWWIQRGHAGAVDLSDLKVVMTGRFKEHGGNPWEVILFVDERATDAQREALTAVFLGRAGGPTAKSYGPQIAEVHAVRSARIELDHTVNAESIDIAPYLTVQTREPAAEPGAVTCGIPGHDHPGREIRAEVFRYKDGPFDWEFRGKCGFATDFAYSS